MAHIFLDRSRTLWCVAAVTLAAPGLGARQIPVPPPAVTVAPTLDTAQRLFYNGSYEASAAIVLALRGSGGDDLAGYELRTSVLHFQVKRAMGESPDKDKALKQCAPCAPLMAAFASDITKGQALARARLKANPQDVAALFFLGKIDLNDVWLHLGTLGRKSGWSEYWEARHSLDAVLQRNPQHVRARVARAWIDYIVDTKVPWAFRWVLGGGNKKGALRTVKEADAEASDADVFAKAEAGFALWEMQVRERKLDEAADVARRLVRDFPDNRELTKFLEARGGAEPFSRTAPKRKSL